MMNIIEQKKRQTCSDKWQQVEDEKRRATAIANEKNRTCQMSPLSWHAQIIFHTLSQWISVLTAIANNIYNKLVDKIVWTLLVYEDSMCRWQTMDSTDFKYNLWGYTILKDGQRDESEYFHFHWYARGLWTGGGKGQIKWTVQNLSLYAMVPLVKSVKIQLGKIKPAQKTVSSSQKLDN